jgi:hypothetical protein
MRGGMQTPGAPSEVIGSLDFRIPMHVCHAVLWGICILAFISYVHGPTLYMSDSYRIM